MHAGYFRSVLIESPNPQSSCFVVGPHGTNHVYIITTKNVHKTKILVCFSLKKKIQFKYLIQVDFLYRLLAFDPTDQLKMFMNF